MPKRLSRRADPYPQLVDDLLAFGHYTYTTAEHYATLLRQPQDGRALAAFRSMVVRPGSVPRLRIGAYTLRALMRDHGLVPLQALVVACHPYARARQDLELLAALVRFPGLWAARALRIYVEGHNLLFVQVATDHQGQPVEVGPAFELQSPTLPAVASLVDRALVLPFSNWTPFSGAPTAVYPDRASAGLGRFATRRLLVRWMARPARFVTIDRERWTSLRDPAWTSATWCVRADQRRLLPPTTGMLIARDILDGDGERLVAGIGEPPAMMIPPLLTERQWAAVLALLPTGSQGGRPPHDDRRLLDGITYVLAHATRWEDLPSTYGSPTTAWRRTALWERLGLWEGIWRAILGGATGPAWTAFDAARRQQRARARRMRS